MADAARPMASTAAGAACIASSAVLMRLAGTSASGACADGGAYCGAAYADGGAASAARRRGAIIR